MENNKKEQSLLRRSVATAAIQFLPQRKTGLPRPAKSAGLATTFFFLQEIQEIDGSSLGVLHPPCGKQ